MTTYRVSPCTHPDGSTVFSLVTEPLSDRAEAGLPHHYTSRRQAESAAEAEGWTQADVVSLSLAQLAARIAADASEIARLTTSPTGQAVATSIALEAQTLASLDLDTPPCGCWVCQGRPQDSHEDACETSREDAAFALRSPASRPDYEPSAEEVLEQLVRDADAGAE